MRRVIWISATSGIAAVIAVLTLASPSQLPPAPQISDKVYHALAFAALVMPTVLMWPKRLVVISALALLYGGVIEMIQPGFGRQAELGDLLANCSGVALAWVLAFALRGLQTRR